MRRFWKRRREPVDLETVLRASRPDPSREFVDDLAGRIRARRSRASGFARARVAFAVGLTVALVSALASVGGLGYAASGAERAVKAAARVVGAPAAKPKQQKVVRRNAAANQYKTTICHKTGSAKNPYVEITVSNNALPAHQKHGDIIPAPPGGCPTR